MQHKRWLAPLYYLDFSCKADKCRNTCCSGWRIPVSRNEYNKLITMECSEGLDRCIQNAFILPEVSDDECYRYISFDWLGQCRILRDGLCQIHTERGEEYLPKICRLYPRSFKNINGTDFVSCSSSCERVVEMLYETDSLSISEIETDGEAQLIYEISDEDIRQISLFNRIITDESTSLAQSIEDICMIINADEFLKDKDTDTDPLNNALDLVKKLPAGNRVLEDITGRIMERYEDHTLFEEDRKVFEKKYPDWEKFFERVMNNSLMYECFPFVDLRADRTKVYKGLCCCYGLLRLVSIGATYDSDDINDLIDAVCALFHLIEHTAFYYNVSLIADNAAAMLKI